MLLFLKRVIITLLLNRSGLAKEDVKNYCFISNLPFISKLNEKVVASLIEEHIEHNYTNGINQSAYGNIFNRSCSLESAH